MTALLAIDTAAELCSVCLLIQSDDEAEASQKIFVKSERAERSHAQRVLPMIQDVLREAGTELSEVGLVVYGRGPGSFTGLRIAVGMVQGLAYGQDLPTLGISNLTAIAQFALEEDQAAKYCLVMQDARMHEVYWGLFRMEAGTAQLIDQEYVNAPSDIDFESMLQSLDGDLVIAGSGLAYTDEMPALAGIKRISLEKYVPAETIARLAQAGRREDSVQPAELAAPIYIRDEVTWKKLPGRE